MLRPLLMADRAYPHSVSPGRGSVQEAIPAPSAAAGLSRPIVAFAAPCVAAWSGWLLAFFPALMSSDSTDQWAQAGNGRLNDWHPVFHTFLLRAARHVWDTPALVAIAQIAALALLVGAGLAVSLRAGVPRIACWIASLAFALSPVTATMVITIWKDVPFSIAVFGALVLLHAAASDRRVVDRRWFWGAFMIANAAALLFRHNGLPVVVGACAALAVIARARRWRAAVALVAALALALAARSAVFRAYDVPPSSMPSKGVLLLGVLAAHVAAGTPLREAERQLLSEIRPLDDRWVYDCQSTVPTMFDGRLRMDVLAAHEDEIPALAGRLTLRAPRVTLAYQACRSSLLWKIPPGRDAILGPALSVGPDLQVSSIHDAPGAPTPHPVLPRLQRALARALSATQSRRLIWIFWRPALALYVLLAAAALVGLRRRDGAAVAILLPILLHTAALAVTIPSAEVRYQYPVFLAAFLLVPSWIALSLARPALPNGPPRPPPAPPA